MINEGCRKDGNACEWLCKYSTKRIAKNRTTVVRYSRNTETERDVIHVIDD